ncbi:MAG: sigma-54 dependent transcriptional regulator [Planctomycetota bacterium]|nr:sigma-54 dependent transcriptional regulator [Planctomycetota bacterium]
MTEGVSRAREVTFEDFRSRSPLMRDAIERARRAAQSDVSMLILGETGTGKTQLASAIHHASARRENPFVNCSVLPASLLESELFGHERGAFTSAERERRGKFELADRGTLFLDEIGNMAPGAQAKILRAVEDKQFERVGGEKTIKADVRILAATNVSLDQLSGGEGFRQDLFYRLAEVIIEIPPLRERKEDIELLVNHFVQVFNEELGTSVQGMSDATMSYMYRYEWPGNLRELRNVIRRGMIHSNRELIWLEDLQFAPKLGEVFEEETEESLLLEVVVRNHIQKVLELTEGNKKKASELLGISRPTLDRKLKKYTMI